MKSVFAARREGSPVDSSLWNLGRVVAPLNFLRDHLIAIRYCRRLCNLYKQESQLQPWLKGKALYVHVVKLDLGISTEEASELVEMAAESYAAWPADRPVVFQDVAHYLVASHLVKRQGWVETEIRSTVNLRVPSTW